MKLATKFLSSRFSRKETYLSNMRRAG